MAAKKKAAKPVPKKLAAAKKTVKKLVKKVAAKKIVKAAAKKPATKKLVPKKAAAKAPAKKLAPKGKPVVKPKIILKPPKLAQKPVTKLGGASKPSAAKAAPAKKSAKGKDPTTDYRNLRKYTHLKLTEIAEDVTGIRATIGSEGGDAPLAAWELIDFLKASEGTIPDWKLKKMPAPDGKPRKRGRPSKADLEARAGKVKPLQQNQAAAAIAKVKANAVKAGIRPAAPVVTAPKILPVVNGVRKIFKLVPRPAATAN